MDEAIVEVDGFERLDENSLARGAGGVDDTGHVATIAGANGDDEAVVAQSDVVLAGGLAAGPEDFLERVPYGGARLDFPCANAPELRRGLIAYFAIGQYGPANGREQRTEIGGRGCEIR